MSVAPRRRSGRAALGMEAIRDVSYHHRMGNQGARRGTEIGTGRLAAFAGVFLVLGCASVPPEGEQEAREAVFDDVSVEHARDAALEAMAIVLPHATISVRDDALTAVSRRGRETRLEIRFEERGRSTAVVAEARRLVTDCRRDLERPVVHRECRSGLHAYTSTPCRVLHRPRTVLDRERECRSLWHASDGSLERRVLDVIHAGLASRHPDGDAALPSVEPPSDRP